MDIMEFFDNCTNDSVVFDALQHEYNKKLIDFKDNVRGCYRSHPALRQIYQKTIKLRKKQLRKLKLLINRIQSEWEE